MSRKSAYRRSVNGKITASVLAVSVLFAVLAATPAPHAFGGVRPGGELAPAQVLDPDLVATLAAADPKEPVVVFVHGATIEEAVGAVDTAGLELVERWSLVGVAVAIGIPEAIRRVASEPSVNYVEPNREIEWTLDSAHVASRAQEAREPASGLLASAELPYDGTGVTIAVNDSGLDVAHPMFVQEGTSKVVRNLRQVCPYYEHDPDSRPCDEWVDVDNSDVAYGHGNLVAGVAAGFERSTMNGRTVRGTAPGANLVGLGSGVTRLRVYGVVSGLNWVLENHLDPCGDGSCPPIRVVNNSWGTNGSVSFNPEAAVSKLSDHLVAAGVVVVFAAGNNGGDGSVNQVSAHARNPTPGVIGVANYDDAGMGSRDNDLHPSSSRGLKADPTTYPDLSAPGTSITSACTRTAPDCHPEGNIENPLVIDPYYATTRGTSLSAPYVAGAAALLLQVNPSLTPAQIEYLVEDTAYQFGPADYVSDPRNSNHATSFDRGHGLVDVTAALAAVLDRQEPAGPVCDDNGLIVDPEGDATDVDVFETGLPPEFSEKALDITRAWITTDPSTGELVFAVRLADLGALPPPGAAGEYLYFIFTYNRRPYEVHMERLGGAGELSTRFRLTTEFAGEVVFDGLQGGFDHLGDLAWAVIPPDVLNIWDTKLPVITEGDVLGSLKVLAQRRAPRLSLTADTARGECPYIAGS